MEQKVLYKKQELFSLQNEQINKLIFEIKINIIFKRQILIYLKWDLQNNKIKTLQLLNLENNREIIKYKLHLKSNRAMLSKQWKINNKL